MTSSPISNPFTEFTATSVLRWAIFIFIAVVLALSLVLGAYPTLLEEGIVSLVLYMAIFGPLMVWCLQRCRKLGIQLRHIVGSLPAQPRWPALGGLILAVLAFSLGSFIVLFYLVSLAAPTVVESLLNALEQDAAPKTALPMIYTGLNAMVTVLLAPIVEEFLFRGVLLQRWSVKWNPRAALIATSILFGVLHANVVGLTMFGLVMGLLYFKTRTLLIPIVAHALNNLIALGLGSLPESAESNLSPLEQFQSTGWTGLVLLMLSLPWLIRFIRQNWPRKDTPIPYLLNLQAAE